MQENAFRALVDLFSGTGNGFRVPLSVLLRLARDPTTTGEWTKAYMSSKARYMVKGLIRHKAYSFRVAALGALGEDPES